MLPFHKTGSEENPESHRPVSLTLVPGKDMEQISLSNIMHHTWDKMIWPSQHEFMKGKSCWTNLISFYDNVTALMGKEKAFDVTYLDFSEAFNIILPQHSPGKNSCLWLG